MTTKKQRTTRRPKTPETPAEAGLTRAVEELVASGEYNGEQGFHDLVKLVSRRFVEAALRGELDAHLNLWTTHVCQAVGDGLGTKRAYPRHF